MDAYTARFSPLPALPPGAFLSALTGLRARLWCDAANLGVRDTDPRLWLHLADGRVLALRWFGGRLNDDGVLAPLVAALADDARGLCYQVDLPGLGSFQLLYAAPVLPEPAPGTRRGWTMRKAYLGFARGLDVEVLDFLASVGQQRFYASVRNYNRLASLPEPLRERRLQALQRFPALVLPILLTKHHSPNLCDGKRHAWREPAPEVEAAIDAGRDLTGALASYYAISRGLVKSPACTGVWETGEDALRSVLRLLDALPANQRPDADELLRDWHLLPAYLGLFGTRDEEAANPLSPAAHAGAFRRGWSTTWSICQRRFAEPRHAMVDSKDFLAAVAQKAADLTKARRAPPLGCFAAAWLAEFGLVDLLSASRRWHELRPMVELDPLAYVLPQILGLWEEGGCCAQEILTARGLAEEGARMRHCVGDYWDDCLNGERIFALTSCDGERATAQYRWGAGSDSGPGEDPQYVLEQLRGPANHQASAQIEAFARALVQILNQPARLEPRRAALRARADYQLALLQAKVQAKKNRQRTVAWLDERSERQLQAVMRRLALVPAGPEVWLRAYVAGYAYHDAERVEDQLAVGQWLSLVREVDNRHDALAVRIDWRESKLGYVPRPDNHEIAQALDEGVCLQARIVALRCDASTWRRLEFVIEEMSPAASS